MLEIRTNMSKVIGWKVWQWTMNIDVFLTATSDCKRVSLSYVITEVFDPKKTEIRVYMFGMFGFAPGCFWITVGKSLIFQCCSQNFDKGNLCHLFWSVSCLGQGAPAVLVLIIESCAGIEAAVSKDFKETVVGDGNGSENSGERNSRKTGAKQRKIGTVILALSPSYAVDM